MALPSIGEFLSARATNTVHLTNFRSFEIRTDYNGKLGVTNEFDVQQAIVQSTIVHIAGLLQDYETLVQQELAAAQSSTQIFKALEDTAVNKVLHT